MCKYCNKTDESCISGAYLKVIPTKSTKEKQLYPFYYKPNCFILKGTKDKKAGLMMDNLETCYYIDINYCPMCGKKLGE